jgi:2'-5' RNA ligase
MRSFIALEMPPAVKEHAAGLIRELRSSGAGMKWVEPANLHLTLKFLGEVDPGLLPEVKAALERACAATPALELAVAGCGAFPGLKRPKVAWLGLSGQVEELAGLAEAVQAAVEPLGFAPERRGFKAHLTLGRLRRGKRGGKKGPSTAPLSRELAALAGHVGPRFLGDQVVLMKSTLTSSGPIYQPLHRVTLA